MIIIAIPNALQNPRVGDITIKVKCFFNSAAPVHASSLTSRKLAYCLVSLRVKKRMERIEDFRENNIRR